MNIEGGKFVIDGDYPSSFNWLLHLEAGHPRKGIPKDGGTQGRVHLQAEPKKGCTQRRGFINNRENMDPSNELLPTNLDADMSNVSNVKEKLVLIQSSKSTEELREA